jgi:ubiquitin-conjugating enzyme E2 Q
MPRKAFIADLQKAIDGQGLPQAVTDVRKGVDDGEFVFTVYDAATDTVLDLNANLSDVSDYPSEHTCFFFAPDNAPASVSKKLDSLNGIISGKPIAQLIEAASNAVCSAVDSEGDIAMADSQPLEESDDEQYESDPDQESDEDIFGDGGTYSGPSRGGNVSGVISATNVTDAYRKRLIHDLRTAKAAGFKVGHHGALLDGGPCYVSLACRISKFDLSDQAMQAWQLDPGHYLILLFHFPAGYRNIDDVSRSDASSCLEMRIGISKTYKPTYQEAVHAFTVISKRHSTLSSELPTDKSAVAEECTVKTGFRDCFISKPLNQLFNERLSKIVQFRLGGMTWTGAEEFLNDHMASRFTETSHLDDKYMAEDTGSGNFPDIVTADHIADSRPGEPLSFPLIAMNFLVRHFVRCTEFCLVCFRRLPDDFEAIKPYVCDNPLCLYQYMSLGFGPSIEHEILAQPYVVDLLVSLCYISAKQSTLRDFPSGLSLNVPPRSAGESVMIYPPPSVGLQGSYPGNDQKADAVTGEFTDAYQVKYNPIAQELLFATGDPCPIKLGDWIVLRSHDAKDTPMNCRITETTYFPTVKISEPIEPEKPEDSLLPSAQPYQPTRMPPKNEFKAASFYIYNVNFDEMSDLGKQEAISNQIQLMPSVSEMASYLRSAGVSSLSTWTERMPPAMLGILRWIIASSRACILQIDKPPNDNIPGKPKKVDERVYGMDGWLQFKFAMGAPDKERRFINAVKSTQQRLKLQFPTLFAWHGSPLNNWHSIIREGLHFNKVSHGRAYGNGVYHSLHCQTSIGYSQMYNYARSTNVNFGGWPQSNLRITSALALNEIVNAPSEFVSQSPHLVVAQLDWIQTRYLFVKIQGENYDANHLSVPMPQDVLEQDPKMLPMSDSNVKLVIPKATKAQPYNKTNQAKTEAVKTGLFGSKRLKVLGKSKNDPIEIDEYDDDDASVCTLQEDLDILVEDNDQKPQSNGILPKKQVDASQTDFVPGSLDIASLPMLEQPSWATIQATKRLQQDFRALLKVQEKEPLHELGWYINADAVSNMYQWIIELHSFESHLPLAKDMKKSNLTSVVLELRFGKDYPMSPPFVRVIRPRFLSFQAGGGGHVTAGGALCMELLTNNGWSAVSSIESVLLQVRLAMSSMDPRPARLESPGGPVRDYHVGEAVDAYIRACNMHGWTVPPGFKEMAYGGSGIGSTAADNWMRGV